MWVRKRIDITWSDLAVAATVACLPLRKKPDFGHVVDAGLTCLSVRSGLDLFLTASQFPPGSEILVSAITIPDMVRVIESHGFVAVPLDVEADSLAMRIDDMKRAITPRTRAVLVAHLFGAVPNLNAVTATARENGLVVFEDCAQAFAGDRYMGHADSDVVAFSFGPIKTATALGGALLRVRSDDTRDRMREIQDSYPQQGRWTFAKRVFKYSVLKLLGTRMVFTALTWWCRRTGRDIDALLSSSVRNFAGGNLTNRLRHQPSKSLLYLMHRRITRFDRRRQDRRTELGQRLFAALENTMCPRHATSHHSHWVGVVCVDEPNRLVTALRDAGFDATSKSQLVLVGSGNSKAQSVRANLWLQGLVFLPFYPEIPADAIDRMAGIIRQFGSGMAECESGAEPKNLVSTRVAANHA